MRDISLFGLVVLMCVVYNLQTAPWDQDLRWTQQRADLAEHFDTHDHTDPLFRSLLKVAHDKHEQHELVQPGYDASAWKAQQSEQHFWCRGEQFSLVCYCASIYKANESMPRWHTTLLTLLYYALQTGQLDRSRMRDLCEKRAAMLVHRIKDDEPGAEHAPLAEEEKERERYLRHMCTNKFHFGNLDAH